MIMSKSVVTLNSLCRSELLKLLVSWISDSKDQVKTCIIRFLSDITHVHAQFRWTSEHRSAPFTNIRITSWIEKTNDGPCHTLQALLD